MKAYQHMKAPNDRNGNPRRLFMVYEGRDFYGIDEGYKGKPAFLRDYTELCPVDISVRDYHHYLTEDTRERAKPCTI